MPEAGALHNMPTRSAQRGLGHKDWLRRQGRFPLACAIYFAVFFGCSVQGYSASRSTAPAAISFFLDGPVGPPEIGALTSLNRGYFSEANLTVRIVEGTAQGQVTALVASTPKAIGVANVFDFLKARAAGQRLVAFASASARSPIVFYARRDSNVKSIADFAEKTVAYDAGHPTSIVLDALLARNGFSKSKIREVAGQRTVSALIERKIDILPGTIGEESRVLDQMGQSFDQINPDAFGLHVPGSVYFTHEDTLKHDPDIVRHFLRAIIRGWDTAYQKNTEDMQGISTALQIAGVDTIRLILDRLRPLLRPSGARFAELDPINLNTALSILVQLRLINNVPRLAETINFDVTKEVYRSEARRPLAN
jgi:ABC-type nitrate/sulfonate/bicarbonate transport system substrate-binding protein